MPGWMAEQQSCCFRHTAVGSARCEQMSGQGPDLHSREEEAELHLSAGSTFAQPMK